MKLWCIEHYRAGTAEPTVYIVQSERRPTDRQVLSLIESTDPNEPFTVEELVPYKLPDEPKETP